MCPRTMLRPNQSITTGLCWCKTGFITKWCGKLRFFIIRIFFPLVKVRSYLTIIFFLFPLTWIARLQLRKVDWARILSSLKLYMFTSFSNVRILNFTYIYGFTHVNSPSFTILFAEFLSTIIRFFPNIVIWTFWN